MRLVPILSAVLVLALCGSAAAGAVATKKLTAKSKDYDISIAYPVTGVKPVDDDVLAWAKSTMAEFKDDSADRDPSEHAYYFEVTFQVKRNDGKVFAVLFDEYTDTGGAHPNHDYYAANYYMPDGWRIYLPELLDGSRGLKRVSALATADLVKRIGTGNDALSDPDTIKTGAAPDWNNFRSFILEPNAIALYYPPYQVAAYAAGPQDGRIPLSALRDVMRPDPRKPAASFDCAGARTPVEQRICSDVVLARLDRDVAEAYSTHMRGLADDPNKPLGVKLKADQRAWLAKRDVACGTAEAACLTAYYRARLAWFAKQP